MKKIAKGKPKKAAKGLTAESKALIAKNKALLVTTPPKSAVMKKVSLFLRAQTIPKAHARAKKLGLSLTAYAASLVEADLKKKAA